MSKRVHLNADLKDVQVRKPQDRQMLQWKDGMWRNASPGDLGYAAAEHTHSIDDLNIRKVIDETYTFGHGLKKTGDVISVVDGEIVHDKLSGFIANEHIDWTNASENFSTTGTLTGATLNTGQGDNELYPMDQAVRTTDSPTFEQLSLNQWLQIDPNNVEGFGASRLMIGKAFDDSELTANAVGGRVSFRYDVLSDVASFSRGIHFENRYDVAAGVTLTSQDSHITPFMNILDFRGDGDTAGNFSGLVVGWHRLRETGNVGLLTGITIRDVRQVGSATRTVNTAVGIDISAQKKAFVTTGYGIRQRGVDDINEFQGNVGIGKIPSTTLDVSGDGRFSGNITLTAGILGTDNFTSETVGWRGTYAGDWDVRSLFTNELRAEAFIADVELALASDRMMSKGIGTLSRDFTIPPGDQDHFDTDLSKWTSPDAGIALVNSELEITQSEDQAGENVTFSRSIDTSITNAATNVAYVITFEIKNDNGGTAEISERGFQIGDQYCRRAGGVWQINGVDTTNQPAWNHKWRFLVFEDETFEWQVGGDETNQGTLVESGVSFAGNNLNFRTEASVGLTTYVNRFRVMGTNDLYVEDLPGFPDTQVFASGDQIRLQLIDRSGGGRVFVKAWGFVFTYTDLVDGEQRWTFRCFDDGGESGNIVHQGGWAQDLGVSGDGFIESSAAGGDTPWTQIATWTDDPSVSTNIAVRTRIGNLSGITGQSGFGLTTRKDNSNYVTQWWSTDSDWGIRGHIAGSELFRWGNDNHVGNVIISRALSTDIEDSSIGMGEWTAGRPMIMIQGTSTSDRVFLNVKGGNKPYLRMHGGGASGENVIIGHLDDAGRTDFGIWAGHDNTTPLFRVSGDTAEIAGWNFDNTKIFKTDTGDLTGTGVALEVSGGIGTFAAYNGGVKQFFADTDGIAYAGGGRVILDSTGITMVSENSDPGSGSFQSQLIWENTTDVSIGRITTFENGTDVGNMAFSVELSPGTPFGGGSGLDLGLLQLTNNQRVAMFGARSIAFMSTQGSGLLTLDGSAVDFVDNQDVTGVAVIECDVSGGGLTLRGFSGGASGQVIWVWRSSDSASNINISHDNANGTEKIRTPSASLESLPGGTFGGFFMLFDGIFWNILKY